MNLLISCFVVCSIAIWFFLYQLEKREKGFVDGFEKVVITIFAVVGGPTLVVAIAFAYTFIVMCVKDPRIVLLTFAFLLFMYLLFCGTGALIKGGSKLGESVAKFFFKSFEKQ